MSQQESPQQLSDIKSQLRNFINLLQTTNPTAYKSMKSSGRLSVILSASQPESSSMDKQNSSQSANLSIKNSQFHTAQNSLISQLLKDLYATGLTKVQCQIVKELSVAIDEIVKRKQQLENRNQQIQQQLIKQKKGTDQLLQALIKLDEQQKDMWNTYYQLSDQYKSKSQLYQSLQKEFNLMKDQVEGYQKQTKFLKKLVYLANQNYEELQQKYNKLLSKSHLASRKSLVNKPVLVLREKRSDKNLLTQRSSHSKYSNHSFYSPFQQTKKRGISPDLDASGSCSPLKKSSISIKSRRSISPLQKDKENIECNFKDVYRKMLMKNLNSKKKKVSP